MDVADFDFELPEALIAQRPLAARCSSRLLCLNRESGALVDRRFEDLPRLLRPHDLLVVNNTRVVRARLQGRKATGGKVEVLLERVIDEHRVLAQVRASKSPGVGAVLSLGGSRATVTGRRGEFYELDIEHAVAGLLEAQGEVPLPPYIRRPSEALDAERYQTVYAKERGAVAAPTAGLHFDETMLEQLRQRGVEIAEVTLHVGAGTFQPLRAEVVEAHRMHAEWVRVHTSVCEAVRRARADGGRVVAVGTTSVRALETAALGGTLQPFEGDTDLYIYPGFRFRVIDAMITNFHLPRSSLVVLVSAFAGTVSLLAAYRHAVERRYRFFSYGDAMFIHPDAGAPC